MTEAREFDSLDVLSAASGVLLSNMNTMTEFINFMVGGNPGPASLGVTIAPIRKSFMAQHPKLAWTMPALDSVKLTHANGHELALAFVTLVGNTIVMRPLSAGG